MSEKDLESVSGFIALRIASKEVSRLVFRWRKQIIWGRQ